MKTILSKIGLFFKWLVITNFGRLLLSFIWIFLWMGINSLLLDNSNYSGWAVWVAFVGVAYLVGFTLVAIVYAWILNPIRDRKAMKKAKAEYEAKEKNK